VHVHVDNRLALLCGERYQQKRKRCNGTNDSHRGAVYGNRSSEAPR
jgi:hypothetical protein